MRALRRAKREAALLIALADIGGVWDVVEATEALTRFADAAVRAALAFLLRRARPRRTAGARSRRARYRERLRRGRAGARQAWGARAQLFERRRPHRALRPRRGLDSAGNGAGAAVCKADPGAGAPHAGADQRRLRAEGRPAPQARSRLDAGRALDAERLRLLRDRRPELGARRADQGAPGGGRPCARRALPRRSRAVHLAQVFRLCGDRRHPRDEAPDPRCARPRAGRRARPRRQARTRRHPRDRVLRPDAAAHLRRTASADARVAHARHASSSSAPTNG